MCVARMPCRCCRRSLDHQRRAPAVDVFDTLGHERHARHTFRGPTRAGVEHMVQAASCTQEAPLVVAGRCHHAAPLQLQYAQQLRRSGGIAHAHTPGTVVLPAHDQDIATAVDQRIRDASALQHLQARLQIGSFATPPRSNPMPGRAR